MTQDRTFTFASSQGSVLRIYVEHVLRNLRRSWLVWTIGLIVYAGAIILVYPSVSEIFDPTMFEGTFYEAFGLEDLAQIGPYIDSQLYDLLPLLLAFYPITVFATTVAGQEERGALDVLFGNPMPRWVLIVSSFLAMGVALLGISVVLGVSTWLVAQAIDVDLELGPAMAGALNMWPVVLMIGTISLLTSTLVRQRAVAVGVAVVIMIAMYLFMVLSELSPDLDWLRYLSVFSYTGDAVAEGFSWPSFFALLGIAVALMGLAVAAFNRRDIYT